MIGTQGGGFEVDGAALAGVGEAWAQAGGELTKVAQSLAALLGKARLLDVDAEAYPVTAQLAARAAAAAMAEAEQTATLLAAAIGTDAQGVAKCARNYQDADECVRSDIDGVVPPPGSPGSPTPTPTPRSPRSPTPGTPSPPDWPSPSPSPVPTPEHDSTFDDIAGSGQVKAWIGQAFAILKASGVPAAELDSAGVMLIIEHESGGDPSAINEWDSNWQAGHPSKGLMQCIDSTFDAYRLPGHGDIYNPVDNIIAGVRYAISRYGSISNVPGVRAVKQGGSYIGY